MIAYLDTSSLVKLFVREDGSDEVHALIAAASAVTTSVIAYTEARGAFVRRAREGSLTEQEHERVRTAFEQEWVDFGALDVTQSIARHAADLAEVHGLRAFDGLHLASFHSIAAAASGEIVRFSSFDRKLSAAAERR